MTLDPDESMKMTIAVLEPERAFVIRSGAPGEPPQAPGSFFRGELAFSWGFYLEPLDERATRLIVRCRAAWADTLAARLARPVLLEPVHFIMEERMLRGIRERAQGPAHLRSPVLPRRRYGRRGRRPRRRRPPLPHRPRLPRPG